MESSISKPTTLKGMHFLTENVNKDKCFTPSQVTEEHSMIKDTVLNFVEERVFKNREKIEKQADGIVEQLMGEIGELGILSAHMPEQYGGMQMDFISNTLIAEAMGMAGSFSVAYNAHTGIGMLPILYFGTEEQKLKYLPKLSSGEWKASYCLTEPSSGSDALSAKTTAELSADGEHYILNGQKMWITNAGFANIFIVFAQLDGDKFTAFIVEDGTEGLTLGAEEDKLGIKGSSTRQVFFENVKIPKDHLLGDIGKGHLIAFNVLNIGRYKLGVSCLGGCKRVTTESVKYANERIQFKVPIANFGAIKHKMAEQAIRIYSLESAIYRIAGVMEEKIKYLVGSGIEYGAAKLQAAEDFALECSIIKVVGSEVLDFVVDENVQIHGGMGYSEEGVTAMAYRDSRINRIFEGTNEINRLLLVNMLFKKAMKGEFDLATPAMQVQQELQSGNLTTQSYDSEFEQEYQLIDNLKKLVFMLSGFSGQLAMSKAIDLKDAQEPMMCLSDIIMDLYVAESTLLRVDKEPASETQTAILKTFMYDANQRIYKNALDIIGSIVDENMQSVFLSGVRKLTKYSMPNTMKLRRQIADELIEANQYSL